MADIDQLVEKFRAKLLVAQEAEKFKNEVVNPLVNKIFNGNFSKVFQCLADELNSKVGAKVITFIPEGKSRFAIEGQFHRVYFQKGKVDVFDNIINAHIIPIYIWKGVTKHLGPISFFVDPDNEEIKWDIPFESLEDYSSDLFGKLVDDVDFSM